MIVTPFCSQKWSSNRAAKVPRDVTLVADYIVILVCSSLLPSLPEEPYKRLNSDSSLYIFSVFERDSLRNAECNQNLCNQRDVKTRSSLWTLFSCQVRTLGGKNSDLSPFYTIRFWAFRKVHITSYKITHFFTS